MTNPNITFYDGLTGLTETREMTDEEFAEHEEIIATAPSLPSAE